MCVIYIRSWEAPLVKRKTPAAGKGLADLLPALNLSRQPSNPSFMIIMTDVAFVEIWEAMDTRAMKGGEGSGGG